MRSLVTLVVLLCSLVTSACAGGDAADADPVDGALIDFEADWMCERQRHAFDDLADLDARFTANREAAGISADTYRTFQEALAADRALRGDVLAAYRIVCS